MRRRYFDYRGVPRPQRALILACMMFWSVLAYMLINQFVVSSAAVTGLSMEPTLANGERFVVNRIGPRLIGIQRGEIVAVKLPGDTSLSVKRVIGLPLERVQVVGGRVYVQGRALIEPYLVPGIRTESGNLGPHLFEVAPDCYFMLGDNREKSFDSRFFGAVHKSDIVGRLVMPRDRARPPRLGSET
jgi:signal peptidase I